MPFEFGQKSLDRLLGVNTDLVAVATRALELSEIDFCILEGLRSHERQLELVATGASQTQHSKHLIGHAIDIGAITGGKVDWTWDLYPKIARAFQQASQELGVPIVFGAIWDRQLASVSSDIPAEIAAYKARRGGKAFMDGGHYELRMDPGLKTT